MHKSYRQKTITFVCTIAIEENDPRTDRIPRRSESKYISIQEDLNPRADRIPRRSKSKQISIQELIVFQEDLNPRFESKS